MADKTGAEKQTVEMAVNNIKRNLRTETASTVLWPENKRQWRDNLQVSNGAPAVLIIITTFVRTNLQSHPFCRVHSGFLRRCFSSPETR